ncbi:hypothetical protein BDV96DRAFT_569423 [Lophiotrema nucula]|uniref:C2H2-type domain-containing protein n=1 Tax=Lophiotrema nucula TaxID=690887 RepID=A0A6A5ZFC5_9PLEO|nr:hypothetical protein BDV96DRAFT_569423 [Lophiotrema nucula]
MSSTSYACTHPGCGRFFSDASHLQHHEITHRDANIKCYGCHRYFTTYGGMIIHLEAGTCPSGIDVYDLNKSAARCFQWRKWIDKSYRSDLLYHVPIGQGEFPYKCPTCDAGLPKLSSLFMHVASPACAQTLNSWPITKLKRWLKNQHRGGLH